MNHHEDHVNDSDPIETQEWLDALESLVEYEGKVRATFLLEKLKEKAQTLGCSVDLSLQTPYHNTLRPEQEPVFPGDLKIEQRIRAFVRWNAAAMVVRAGKQDPDLGGHIGTFASAATLYEVGFNHFWRAANPQQNADLLYIQGHSSPGIYARSFLEGVLSEAQLDHFRQEVEGQGLSSYPHPWLMPNYWQFPTVSMGLGPIQAIYQARFMRYLEARGLIPVSDRKVWCFCGDGEMDEPESVGALSIAAREGLDNLIFVVNCNLQRLDGPVRGNGKIIQELESIFKGAAWNVIKVIWGDRWDQLFQADKTGLLLKRMEEAVDGEYQNYKAHGGAYTREHFFGKYPELQALVKDWSDEDIAHLNRGGHDPKKVYAAYKTAVEHKGKPTVILAKTVKGYGLGDAGEALNIAHNAKKMNVEQLQQFRDRFNIPIDDASIAEAPFYKPAANSPEAKYMLARRKALGGSIPARRVNADESLSVPPLAIFDALLSSTADRKISTTMVLVRILGALCKDKALSARIVPIIPDEARTFGMEGLFRQLGIYAAKGQAYKPVDAAQVMYYKEAKDGQILEEGLNEAGAFCSWLSAATSYSTHNIQMIPFYTFYSMFGFQRIGDLAWAAADARARGFLIGATAGRTTLNGEGLQHEDGHSHIMASTIPNCVSYDPTFSYELAVIIHHGLQRMVGNKEDIYYYITVMNENYVHPEMQKGTELGIIKGMYRLSSKPRTKALKHKVQLLGSGTILLEVMAAAELLAQDFGIAADVWSVTSFNECGREGMDVDRWNRLHPLEKAKTSYVHDCLVSTEGPVIAATDYMRAYAEQLRVLMPRGYYTLGTDGFGRSDTRKQLRRFFEVDRFYVVLTALQALADEGTIDKAVVAKAIKQYNIHPDKPNPTTV